MAKSDKKQTQARLPDAKTEKYMRELIYALEHTYGNLWKLVWRNFIAGIMHALGATVGYLLLLTFAIVIAQKLGIFDTIKNAWDTLLQKLPDERLELRVDPETLKKFQQ